MNLRRTLPLYCLLTLVVAAQNPSRDRRDERHDESPDRGREPRVILYEKANFGGDALIVYAGDSLENLARVGPDGGRSFNDRISSIRVEGGAEVYLYVDAGYHGAAMRLVESARDLTGRLLPGSVSASWNDRISSLRVEVRRRDESREEPTVIIKRAFTDLLGREPDPIGLRDYRSLIIDQGWNERMVREQIRRGDEFRGGGADRIIRRAYLDVLEREPDPTGLKEYRRDLLEKDWTEGDVRDALRKSEEFRKKSAGRR